MALASCEVGVRAKVRTHLDEQHRNEIPHLARALRNQPSPRILFLGNSLTRKGIRLDSFKEALRDHGLRVGGCAVVRPDDTVVQHWYYLFQRYFADANESRTPDCVIITFCLDHLSDQVAPRNRRLASIVKGPGQLAEVLCHDLDSVDACGDFLMAHFFSAVANQSEIKHGVMARIIPHYASESQRLNRVRRAYHETKDAQERFGNAPALTYSRLERFIALLQQRGCHGVFAMIPLPGEQSLDIALAETIESNGMTFCDFRDLSSLTSGHYPDGYHMDPVAADIYSRALADAVAARIPDLLTRNTRAKKRGHH